MSKLKNALTEPVLSELPTPYSFFDGATGHEGSNYILAGFTYGWGPISVKRILTDYAERIATTTYLVLEQAVFPGGSSDGLHKKKWYASLFSQVATKLFNYVVIVLENQ